MRSKDPRTAVVGMERAAWGDVGPPGEAVSGEAGCDQFLHVGMWKRCLPTDEGPVAGGTRGGTAGKPQLGPTCVALGRSPRPSEPLLSSSAQLRIA